MMKINKDMINVTAMVFVFVFRVLSSEGTEQIASSVESVVISPSFTSRPACAWSPRFLLERNLANENLANASSTRTVPVPGTGMLPVQYTVQ